MTEQEIIDLVFQTNAATAAAGLAEFQAKLRDVDDAMKQGLIGATAHQAATDRLTQSYLEQARAARASASAVVDTGSTTTQASNAAMAYSRSLQSAATGAGSLGYKLQVMGQGLDDLQYVGEQGLRPIINNLMQVNAALGVGVIVGNQVYKHWDELSAIGPKVAESFGWVDDANKSTSTLATGIRGLGQELMDAGKAASKFGKDYMEGLDALMGGPQKRDAASIKKFEEGRSTEELAAGAAVKKTLDSMSHEEVLDMLMEKQAKLSPDFAKVDRLSDDPEENRIDKQVRDHERARISELLTKAMAGDPNAVASAKLLMQGTPLGNTLHENDPATIARRKAQEEEVKEAAKRNQELGEAIDKQVDDANKAKGERADEIGAAMGKQIGKDLLANAAKGAGGESADFIGVLEKDKIAKKLLTTGQAKDEAEARTLADLIYKRIFDATWKKIRDKVNATGMAIAVAAGDVLIGEQGGQTLEQRRAELQRRIDAQRQANQGGADALMGRMAAAAGVDGQVQFLQMQARQNMAMNPRFQRQLAGLGFEGQEQAIARANQQTDEQIQKQVEAKLLGQDGPMIRGRRMRGSRPVTDDPLFAKQLAQDIVQRNRKGLDNQTGDQPVERNTEATKTLTDAMNKLAAQIDKGLEVKLGP